MLDFKREDQPALTAVGEDRGVQGRNLAAWSPGVVIVHSKTLDFLGVALGAMRFESGHGPDDSGPLARLESGEPGHEFAAKFVGLSRQVRSSPDSRDKRTAILP